MKLKERFYRIKQNKWVNKYSITLVVFILWISFFDSNSFVKRYATYLRQREVNHEIRNYNHEISANKALLDALGADTETLERYAREHYKMKQSDEDVYIVKE